MNSHSTTPVTHQADAEQTVYTIAELAGRIRGAVRGAFPETVWVTGEVANLTRSQAGHIYLDLMERVATETGERRSLLRAVIWESRRAAINQALRKARWGRVSDGDELKVRVGVQFYAAQGRITLQIHEVDPQYTLSRWKKERERVVAALREEGIFDDNRRLHLSPAPWRVGLITSGGSNAQADFLTTLTESGLGWQVEFHHSAVQGEAARASVTGALARVVGLRPDVVCIVRGGGSTTDLAVFDDVEVARAIARCPAPVITGIGHELDQTVSDLVAHRSEKTPTACASFLVNRNRLYLRRLERVGRSLAEQAGSVVSSHRRRLDRSPLRLRAGVDGVVARGHRRLHRSTQMLPVWARSRLSEADATLRSHGGSLQREARRALRTERTRLDNAVAVTEAYDPRRILARGWSITRRRGGGVIRSISGVAPDQEIETWLSDGTVVSRVLETTSGGRPDNEKGDRRL